MSNFRQAVGELTGLNEPVVFKSLPGGIEFDRPGDGFEENCLKSAILCTARSGSSLLSVALQAYGFDFQEYLNPNGQLKQIVTGNDVRTTSELAPHFAKATTVDGRMSIKTPPNSLQHMFAMGEFPKNLEQWRFVYLRRENLIRQAISGAIAQRTGQWTKNMPKTGDVSEDDYSFEEILRLVNAYANGNRAIERFIGLLGLDCYNITYEEFLRDQKTHLAKISQHLGVDPADYPDAKDHEPWLERQATGLNKAWEERFRTDMRGRLDA